MAEKNLSYDGARAGQGSSEDQVKSSTGAAQRRRRHSGPSRRSGGQSTQVTPEVESQTTSTGPSESAVTQRKRRPARRPNRKPAEAEPQKAVAEEAAIRRDWPTAEIACSTLTSDGRLSTSPRVLSPDAIAPELTITAEWPDCLKPAICEETDLRVSWEIEPSELVTEEDPSFTTSRN